MKKQGDLSADWCSAEKISRRIRSTFLALAVDTPKSRYVHGHRDFWYRDF